MALAHLKAYLFKSKNIEKYKLQYRTSDEAEFTSKLSPWLANGCLSPRKVYYEVKRFEKKHGETKASGYFLSQLLWKDFFCFWETLGPVETFDANC